MTRGVLDGDARTCMAMIRCSTVSLEGSRRVMMSLDTFTSRVCPSRWHRSTACASKCFLYSLLYVPQLGGTCINPKPTTVFQI